MSKIDVKFAELHNPLFFGGKNFQMKLDCSALHGLKLIYDRAEKELLVFWENKHCIIPASNVACMVEGLPEVKPVHNIHPIVQGIRSAQVDSPQSHVHAGAGHGKTGKDK